MTAAPVQASLFPVTPYGDVPHRATETSAAGAAHIAPKVGNLQRRVLLALYELPGMTQTGLDRRLGVELGRSARPRVTELRLAGYVEECGTCMGEAGVRNNCYQLTAAGIALARDLLGANCPSATVAASSRAGVATTDNGGKR